MKISREDARLFFELFLPLLDFTNKRFNTVQCDERLRKGLKNQRVLISKMP